MKGKNLVFGGKCTESLAYWNQESLCWRMSQQSLLWVEPMSLDRLPKSGMTVNGQLYQLHNVEHPTEETDGSQWHIPKASQTAAGMLPTPTATGSEHKTRYAQGGRPLMYMILQGMLPTPVANDSKNTPTSSSRQSGKHHRCPNTVIGEQAIQNGITGKNIRLHPQFVEWMMGFPIGWTD